MLNNRGINFDQVIAVTNRNLCKRDFLEQLQRVCQLHPRAVILREKDLSEAEYERLAEKVMEICRKSQVPCVLHTFPDAAARLGASALHLPLHLLEMYREDENKNTLLKQFSTIGTSIHSTEDLKKAQKLGATYVTAGHIFTTDCKKGLPPRGLEFLRTICENAKIPVYAIGGIQTEGTQLREVIECGAAGGCIMSGMMVI